MAKRPRLLSHVAPYVALVSSLQHPVSAFWCPNTHQPSQIGSMSRAGGSSADPVRSAALIRPACRKTGVCSMLDDAEHSPHSREQFLQGAALAAAGFLALPAKSQAAEEGPKSVRPLAYRIDFTDPPTTVPFPTENLPKLRDDLIAKNILFIGEHHNITTTPSDVQVELDLLQQLYQRNKQLAVGLEHVQQAFQPALDAYVGRTIPDLQQADQALLRDTKWEERWPWPIELWLPVLHWAREKGVPLVALNPDSDAIFRVQSAGLDGLTAEERNQYVIDFKGFITFVKDPGFRKYADRVILGAYADLTEQGALGDKGPSKANYFASRIFRDEALASKAVEYSTEHPGSCLAVLQAEDHVKFGFGSSGRAQRIAASFGGKLQVATILINPTAVESYSGSRALRLTLGYAEELEVCKPLADYILFSKSPKVQLIPRMMEAEDYSLLGRIKLYQSPQKLIDKSQLTQ